MSNNKLFLLAGTTFILAGAVAFSVTTFASPSQEIQDAITNKDYSAYQQAVAQKQADNDCQGEPKINSEEDFNKLAEMKAKITQAREARQNGDFDKANQLKEEANQIRAELGFPERKGQKNGEGQNLNQGNKRGSQDGQRTPKGGQYGRNAR